MSPGYGGVGKQQGGFEPQTGLSRPGYNCRARPNVEEEQEANFQEEEYIWEEEYYENNKQYQVEIENQLRARPLIVPCGRIVELLVQ